MDGVGVVPRIENNMDVDCFNRDMCGGVLHGKLVIWV